VPGVVGAPGVPGVVSVLAGTSQLVGTSELVVVVVMVVMADSVSADMVGQGAVSNIACMSAKQSGKSSADVTNSLINCEFVMSAMLHTGQSTKWFWYAW
jgi:hypothetical protein